METGIERVSLRCELLALALALVVEEEDEALS